MRGGCTARPTMSIELSEMPVEVVADASNAAHTFIVVLDSLMTMCMGMYLEVCSSLLEGPPQHAAGQSTLV